jgi:radical SAM superfamily enzyme YgiQ (UPF0313 family)
MGLGYVAASLGEAGHEVSILDPDPLGMDLDGLERAVRRSDADVVGIGSSTPTIEIALEIARWAKGPARPRTGPRWVVLGGPHVSALPRETLAACAEADAVCVGEGERTAVELVAALESDGAALDPERIASIPGLALRDGDRIVLTPARPTVDDVDRIPPPARDLVDLTLYRPHVYADRGRRTTTLLTSRGCPFHCSFCASHVTMERPYRGASPARVMEEIETLVSRHGMQDFLIVDDNFAHDRERVEDLCERLIARRLDLGFFCFSRVNRATPDLLGLMRRAGFYGVYFGAESAHRRTLKLIRKGQTPDDVESGIRAARAAGLKTMAGFIIGLPGETAADIEETIDQAVRLSPTIGSFNELVPYPGTEERARLDLTVEAAEFGRFVPKARRAYASGSGLSEAELERLMYRAHLRFYGRPGQIARMVREASTWGEVLAYARGAFWLALRMFAWLLASCVARGHQPRSPAITSSST